MTLVAVVACAVIAVPCYGQNKFVTEGDKTKLDTLSYAMGVNMGVGIKQQLGDIAFNADVVSRAAEASLKGKATNQ